MYAIAEHSVFVGTNETFIVNNVAMIDKIVVALPTRRPLIARFIQ